MSYKCYIIHSQLAPKLCRKPVYIGITKNVDRRLREHNREIARRGAKKTLKKYPLFRICFVTGFRSKKQAMRFEWALQHPSESRYFKYVPDNTHFKWPYKISGFKIANSLNALKLLLNDWNDVENEADHPHTHLEVVWDCPNYKHGTLMSDHDDE